MLLLAMLHVMRSIVFRLEIIYKQLEIVHNQ